ncbi:hypothetical protein OF83DRAFT_1178083 [Amylostereum chailletii]|nr:hypothetical protein OF83DRAFT_1178083 [Amylostereum chailletii]
MSDSEDIHPDYADKEAIEEAINAYLSSPNPSELLDPLYELTSRNAWLFHEEVLMDHVRLRTTHSSQDQDKLVSMVVALEARAATDDAKPGPEQRDSYYPLGWAIREMWTGPENHLNTAEQWTSLNAFIARLAQAGLGYDMYGIWGMREALEGLLSKNPPEQWPGWIRGAAVWPLYAGERMCALSRNEIAQSEDCLRTTDLSKGGENWKDSQGYTVGRWEFWKDELKRIADGSELAYKLEEDDRELVRRAYQAMQDLDDK